MQAISLLPPEHKVMEKYIKEAMSLGFIYTINLSHKGKVFIFKEKKR